MFRKLAIYLNQEITYDQIIAELIDFGFHRVDTISEPGDFAFRGSIFDIFLVDFQDPLRVEFLGNTIEKIVSYDIESGRTINTHKNAVILSIKGITPRKIKKLSQLHGESIPIDNFVDIAPGDHVVHIEYGIGKYLGIEKTHFKENHSDAIVIEYADKDKLFIPYDELHLVQKYIGFEGHPPKLYKLGSKKWKLVKERAKKGIYSLASEMLNMHAKRTLMEGYAFSKDCQWQKELENAFVFEETVDQLNAIQAIKKDMEKALPMDRLLCGDVGYGKTEVALRSAFKAINDNKQVAMLVPTTILAEQHYKTFLERFSPYPVVIQMLSRFRTASQQKIIIEQLAQGQCDMIIGTHRLLSKDVHFKELGLVIIDEEQRFGVQHKERLKQLRLMVDVLTLTATPIPRTLYLSLMGARDMSIINSPPLGRLAVQTYVGVYDDVIIKKALEREYARNGQVFFVHNRVYNIDAIARHVKSLIPKARIAVGHGQMSPHELEKIMIDFINGDIDILVSTTIIESGIDIPNANTIIINDADKFGLADLYQLRGRVGRYKNKAYAYFLHKKGSRLSFESQKRLNAIEKHTELGAGFKIAMEDLQIRGAGNILGQEQHGFICSVGFDLYCRLLREALTLLK